MIRGRNIICFAPYDWSWKTHGSCKRLMGLFARENRVLYINNIQFLMPRVREIGTQLFCKRLVRKMKGILNPLFRASEQLYVYHPLILPHYGKPSKKRFNIFCLRWQMKFLQKMLGFGHPIVWIENPVGISVAKQLNPSSIVYNQIDKYECHSELRDPLEIVRLDNRLTAEADLIFCVSLKLYEEKLATRKAGVHYVPHGVDFEHFNQAATDRPLPEDIQGIHHPIVGYFGTLDAKNDDAMIRYCATRRTDLSFVLIGEVPTRNKELCDLPNVYFLGYKPYEQLPSYGRVFDVCVMFWKRNEWIQHCHPVKTMEYLAMGKPVVSVPFDEVTRRYDGVVSVAGSPEEFLSKIEDEIANDSEARRQRRVDFVRRETWEARVESISQLISERERHRRDPITEGPREDA